ARRSASARRHERRDTIPPIGERGGGGGSDRPAYQTPRPMRTIPTTSQQSSPVAMIFSRLIKDSQKFFSRNRRSAKEVPGGIGGGAAIELRAIDKNISLLHALNQERAGQCV